MAPFRLCLIVLSLLVLVACGTPPQATAPAIGPAVDDEPSAAASAVALASPAASASPARALLMIFDEPE